MLIRLARLGALLMVTLVLCVPASARTQDFPPGTPLGEAWAAFVEAQNAEDGPTALERIEAVAILVEARHGRESREMASVLGYRTIALQRLGRLTDAEAAAQDALTISRRVSGPKSPATLDAINTLAVVYLADRGQGAQRRAFAEEAVRLLEAVSMIEGSETASIRNSLAAAYGLLGRHDEAITLYQAMLEPLTTTRPPTDPEVVTLSVNLAQTYVAAGRDEEAELLLGELVGAMTGADAGAGAPTLQHANLLSVYARATLFPERRAPALRQAVAIYHRAGCRDAEALRDQWVAAGGHGYPWSAADPACPGDVRLARELSGFRGLAYVERLDDPPRHFASVRHLAQASDVVIGATRLTYARNPEARIAFNRYRHVHREFVDSAWVAGE